MRTNGNGNRRPEEIQAEIQRTRREMDGTLSAIEQRLTPGQLVDQGLTYLKNSGGQEFVSNLGQQAKQNPLPVALVGIGLAWLMATGKSTGTAGTEPEPGIKQKAAEAKARLGETASAIGDSAREQMDRARSNMDSVMREQPLVLGAVGLAIGALAAALAPRTQPEQQLAAKVNEVANPERKEGQAGQTQYPDPSVDPLKNGLFVRDTTSPRAGFSDPGAAP